MPASGYRSSQLSAADEGFSLLVIAFPELICNNNVKTFIEGQASFVGRRDQSFKQACKQEEHSWSSKMAGPGKHLSSSQLHHPEIITSSNQSIHGVTKASTSSSQFKTAGLVHLLHQCTAEHTCRRCSNCKFHNLQNNKTININVCCRL